MAFGVTTILVFFVVFLLAFFYRRRRRDLPPGPLALPIFGSVGFIWDLYKHGLTPYEAFARAAKRTGPVLGIRFGPKLVVVLNGYDTIRQALVVQAADFKDRPNWLPQIRIGLKRGKGLIWSNGEEWRKVRKFSLQHLRSFGFGTDKVEDKILEEVEKVTKLYQETNSKLFQSGDIFIKAVSNVICGIIFGKNFGYDEPPFLALLAMIRLVLSGQGFLTVTNYIPEYMYPLFPKENAIFQQKKKNYDTIRQIIEQFIKSHEETFDENNIRDFLDYYIKVKKDETLEDNLANEPYFNSDNIIRAIYDFFIAGSETSSTALEWSLLYLIEYPDVQQRCCQQIAEVVEDKRARLADRSRLPYIDAFIQEVLRLSNVAPLGVPRTNAERDIFINGFRIPKRTSVLVNLYSANTDPKYWKDPLKFNPDRFLDDQGQLLKTEAFVPLSIGPRNCPGDSLARMELFLFLTVLLQRFKFEREEGAPPNDFTPLPGITLLPKRYKLKAIPRIS